MARRKSTTESTTTDAQEGTVSTDTSTTPEAPIAPAEGTESNTTPASTTPAKTDAPVDLSGFQAKVAEVLAEKDETTGDLAEKFVADVNTEYRKLDGLRAKNAARAWIETEMGAAMDDMRIADARAYHAISKGLSAGSGGGSTRTSTPVDPTEAFVQLAAGLRLAMVLASANVPDGVAEDWSDKAKALATESQASAEAYRAWVVSDAEDKGDAPETPAFVQAAVKLSTGKAARVGGVKSGGGNGGQAYNGPRRDVAKHISNAFADKESGEFLTIAQIRAVKSEEYGDDAPSSGAISARLFPASGNSSVEGVVPSEKDGKKGAVKA